MKNRYQFNAFITVYLRVDELAFIKLFENKTKKKQKTKKTVKMHFYFGKVIFNRSFNQFIMCMSTAWCTRLKNTQNVTIFEEIDFFTNFSNMAFSENRLQILKIAHSVKLR